MPNPPGGLLALPPRDPDELANWFDRVSTRLVLIEPDPLEEVRRALDAFEAAVRAHLRSASAEPLPPGVDGALRTRLATDHERFATSLQQLEWFYAVVAREDQGGHRQALGQYGRLVAEAWRRHREEERAARTTRDSPPSSNPK